MTDDSQDTILYVKPAFCFHSADYVTWSGANPDLVKGSQKLAHGPDRSIRMERSYKAHGPNGDLCKGPAAGLAKGSMYAAMKDVVVKCN